jgi:hypothetical protein
MSYGLLGLKNQMEGDAMKGVGDLAGQQRQAERAEDQMDQADRSQTMSAVGMGAGIGMMAGGPMGAAIGAGVGYLASEIF